MIVILVGLTYREFNTVFYNSYLCQLLSTKKTIHLNEDYWGQNLRGKETVSKKIFLTSPVLSARRDLSFFKDNFDTFHSFLL